MWIIPDERFNGIFFVISEAENVYEKNFKGLLHLVIAMTRTEIAPRFDPNSRLLSRLRRQERSSSQREGKEPDPCVRAWNDRVLREPIAKPANCRGRLNCVSPLHPREAFLLLDSPGLPRPRN